MTTAHEEQVFSLPEVLADRPTHYCPGCHHGIVHRLVADCLTSLGLVEKTICIGSIGCSVFIYNYLLLDTVEAPHGRAPAVATGVKRARPENFVFTYQGDGDLRQPRGKGLCGFRQQHGLRHDRRPDGPHHPRGAEDHNLPGWAVRRT